MPRPPRYASDTDVPPERSRAQIEMLLRQHGATEYATGWDPGHDRIQFMINKLVVRFVLPRPDRKLYEKKTDRWGYQHARTPQQVDAAIAQADRQRWRALHLVVRAKLEAVEANISTFEQEFLAYIVLPNGASIGDILVPQLLAGESPRLLPSTSQ